ncbi:putative transporter slc-17.2 isoform X2 [Babylonia areolata]
MCVVYFQRVSLSLAIVCMVNHTALHLQHLESQGLYHNGIHTDVVNNNNNDSSISNTTSTLSTFDYIIDLYFHSPNDSRHRRHQSEDDDERCHVDEQDEQIPNSDEDGPFAWDKQTQGLILASIYIGYTLFLIPGNYVIHLFGVRLTVGCSIAVMSVCHVLCHPAALLSPWAVLGLRIVMGGCTAFTLVGMYGMWTRWAPTSEQSQLLGITFSGEMIAIASAFPLSALLCQYGFWGGWPSTFYTFGGLGLLWSVVWFLLMTDSPENHPRISANERQHIITNRADVTLYTEKASIPWKNMLMSSCFWAIALAQFAFYWGYFMLVSNLPTFLYETMHFDIQSNGVYSMLPYIALFLVVSGTGFIFDAVIKRRLLSKLAVRRLSTTLAFSIPAVLLVVMSHLQCQQVAAVVVLLTVAVGVTGLAMTGGFFVNPFDIAPRYAASICTVISTIGVTAGIINPYLVAAVTVDQTREQWQMVFYVTAGVYLSGTFIFCLLVKVDVQPWAHPFLQEVEYIGKDTKITTVVEYKERDTRITTVVEYKGDNAPATTAKDLSSNSSIKIVTTSNERVSDKVEKIDKIAPV